MAIDPQSLLHRAHDGDGGRLFGQGFQPTHVGGEIHQGNGIPVAHEVLSVGVPMEEQTLRADDLVEKQGGNGGLCPPEVEDPDHRPRGVAGKREHEARALLVGGLDENDPVQFLDESPAAPEAAIQSQGIGAVEGRRRPQERPVVADRDAQAILSGLEHNREVRRRWRVLFVKHLLEHFQGVLDEAVEHLHELLPTDLIDLTGLALDAVFEPPLKDLRPRLDRPGQLAHHRMIRFDPGGRRVGTGLPRPLLLGKTLEQAVQCRVQMMKSATDPLVASQFVSTLRIELVDPLGQSAHRFDDHLVVVHGRLLAGRLLLGRLGFLGRLGLQFLRRLGRLRFLDHLGLRFLRRLGRLRCVCLFGGCGCRGHFGRPGFLDHLGLRFLRRLGFLGRLGLRWRRISVSSPALQHRLPVLSNEPAQIGDLLFEGGHLDRLLRLLEPPHEPFLEGDDRIEDEGLGGCGPALGPADLLQPDQQFLEEGNQFLDMEDAGTAGQQSGGHHRPLERDPTRPIRIRTGQHAQAADLLGDLLREEADLRRSGRSVVHGHPT